MPQMAPMNWLMLFLMFIIVFLMFNILNFFSFFYTMKKLSHSSNNKKSISWKW
uniref:ATP synthase complex subunit 8 n=1 Tax=Staphylinidae sp. BMNH 1274252 TaxID=1796573 RepID=A0A126TDR9_9COLE|nr:ATP synthase F0 subunit 8 [Staphylinidae sp. BMNH 1274252]